MISVVILALRSSLTVDYLGLSSNFRRLWKFDWRYFSHICFVMLTLHLGVFWEFTDSPFINRSPVWLDLCTIWGVRWIMIFLSAKHRTYDASGVISQVLQT